MRRESSRWTAVRMFRPASASGTATRAATGKARRWWWIRPITTAKVPSVPAPPLRVIKGIPQSEALHVVERFTRTSFDTISYEVTIDDPPMYTRPWKAAFPLTLGENYRIYEYACHEGNHAVENVLSGGRALDKAAH